MSDPPSLDFLRNESEAYNFKAQAKRTNTSQMLIKVS